MTITGPPMATVTVFASDSGASEPGTNTGRFRFSRAGPTNNAVVVHIQVAGTAAAGNDYSNMPSSVTFAAGSTNAILNVHPIDDNAVECKETVVLTISPNPSYQVGSLSNATVAIADNDLPTVNIVASDPFASEPGPNTGSFRVTRAGCTNSPLTVHYTLAGTTTPGIDYSNLTGIVTIPVGWTNAAITIRPLDDLSLECPETVIATLSANSNYVIGASSSAVVTISDNELPTVSIVASDPTASEPGVDTGRYTVRRTGCTNVPLTVSYTLGGTARGGIDYSNLTGSVTIPVGFTNSSITVKPFDDASVEASETVFATLSSRPHYVIGAPSSATVTIADNDSATATGKTSATAAPVSSPPADSSTSSALVKTWEVRIRGSERGSGFLSFHEDFTVEGHGITRGCVGIWTISGTWGADTEGAVVGKCVAHESAAGSRPSTLDPRPSPAQPLWEGKLSVEVVGGALLGEILSNDKTLRFHGRHRQ